MDKGRHLGYCSLIGVKGSSSEKRKKKMNTATDQEAVDISFSFENECTVVITFIDTDRHLFDRTRYALGKLIDSHKQPATYGWSLNVNALMALTKVGA
jgi:uncharacterized membrane protein YjjP (DUF1212 family)